MRVGSCYKGIYKDNTVVYISRPLMCYGGGNINAQPKCEHIDKCRKESREWFRHQAKQDKGAMYG